MKLCSKKYTTMLGNATPKELAEIVRIYKEYELRKIKKKKSLKDLLK